MKLLHQDHPRPIIPAGYQCSCIFPGVEVIALDVPHPVLEICQILTASRFQAFVVGGAVRDSILGRPVNDWDVATDALPDETMSVFEHTVPTGLKYGTVTVIQQGMQVEVTTFRRDGPYGDLRHPAYVEFVPSIVEDLARRDFTMNALALDPLSGRLVDPFGGLNDIDRTLIRTVGPPAERFGEDALRMMRAVRFRAELGFTLDADLVDAIRPDRLGRVSIERVRDEFSSIAVAPRVSSAVRMLKETGLLKVFLPELAAADVTQNEYHSLSVLDHSLAAAENVQPELHLRLAALLHDVGKTVTRTTGSDGRVHFYGHERAGALMARDVLARLRYPKQLCTRVSVLIGEHMSALREDASDRVLRRIISRVGKENICDLIALRRADRSAGKQHQEPLNVTELTRRIERILGRGDAVELTQLAIDGAAVKTATGLAEGPKIGRILQKLLNRVMDDPALNSRDTLIELAKTLASRVDE